MKWLEYTSIPFTIKSCAGVGSHFPSPGDLPNPGIERGSPSLQADSLPSEPPGKPLHVYVLSIYRYTNIYTHTYFGSFCLYVISIPSHIIFPKYFPLREYSEVFSGSSYQKKENQSDLISFYGFSSKISVFLNITGPCNYINVVILNPVM